MKFKLNGHVEIEPEKKQHAENFNCRPLVRSHYSVLTFLSFVPNFNLSRINTFGRLTLKYLFCMFFFLSFFLSSRALKIDCDVVF